MYYIFDLDGTLAPIGKGISNENIERLRELEAAGHTIAICSGKPVFYLCGFMRQVGLKAPILIGENGAVIQFGVDIPAEHYFVYPVEDSARYALDFLKEHIEARCKTCGKEIWFQPNETALTVFPRDAETFDVIQDFLDWEEVSEFIRETNLVVYRHADSFDIVPGEINKGNGLKWLVKILREMEDEKSLVGKVADSEASVDEASDRETWGVGQSPITLEDMIAVGDGTNDIPMFEAAGKAIVIGEGLEFIGDERYREIGEMLWCQEKVSDTGKKRKGVNEKVSDTGNNL